MSIRDLLILYDMSAQFATALCVGAAATAGYFGIQGQI